MSGRTLVVVFFFWALLTFITPTLVQLSESHKIKSKLNGEKMGVAMRPRKVLDYVGRQVERTAPILLEKSPPRSIATPPAPAPAPVQRIRGNSENRKHKTSILTGFPPSADLKTAS